MPSPPVIKELVERFKFNIEDYKKGNYNETQVRREFIDPFFKALGWDVANEKGYAEAYKDVVHEFSLKTKDKAEAPDYLFRIGGTKKFFVEAKKPSVNLKDDISPAFQLRRYAWSAKLPLSILTDFEELAVYDCRIQPKKTDKSSTARINYFTYEEYIDRWDEIESIFSREAILKGSFDKFAESNKGKRGTAEVDDAFLKEIEKWRELLARNIALRNESLSNRELNFAVQKTIDRIIFLRICEDRGIEDYGQLMNLQNGANVYQRLLQIFTRADEKYNSGLFHFDDEKDRKEEPDKITPALTIDDDKLKEIIKNLYYPDSPYEFSVLPSDILGHVYEQFLGKVIRLTPGHRAVVEEKPEVKKAGGVYYTPTYIVDYIVKNTLGKKLEEIEKKYLPSLRHSDPPKAGKESHHKSSPTPNDINKAIKAASKIKVLDPACGSGSFLIGAYQYLLDWHIKLYSVEISFMKSPGVETSLMKSLRKDSPVYQTKEGDYRLTTTEKKRILLNNIYGVDIDSQAVEVTKLSLLLKVLEGETEESLTTQLSMFRERALPDLSSNIKCGNSLIGPDFYEQTELDLDEEEHYRINVFDWNEEFKEIMNDGGFDCVIGNPPYIKAQALVEFYPNILPYLREKYRSVKSGNFDIYIVFLERATRLINKEGKIGFIVPHKFMNSSYGNLLRNLIIEENLLEKILHFDDYQIFQNASTYTCLLFLSKQNTNEFLTAKINSKDFHPDRILNVKFDTRKHDDWINKSWDIINIRFNNLLNKINNYHRLEYYTTNIFQGPKSGADNVFILKLIEERKREYRCFSNTLNKEVSLEKELVIKYIKGKNIKRYFLDTSKSEITIYPYDEEGNLINLKRIKEIAPNVYSYLSDEMNKKILVQRERGRFKNEWWQYSRPQNMKIIFEKKLLTPFNAFYNSFALDNYNDFVFSAGVSGAYGILLKENYENYLKSILGILNSKLVFFWIQQYSTSLRGGFYSFENKYIKNIPIALESNSIILNEIEILTDKLIADQIKINKNKTPQEKKNLERQIAALDKQIDQLVYELYGLTEDEIKIVEESMK